jgi:succinate dehydrogenase/fumarate reductase flavoprotein subunit
MPDPVEPHALLSADVLVVGGGPAGTWAAIKAAQAGADVVLVDKGRCGSSGATASVGTGIWYVEDEPELREAAMASREALGGHLADRGWMARVLDETYARMDELARVQRYPFPVDGHGRQIRDDLQGPEYMRRQRVCVQRLGVRILDHTPALELLVDADRVVSGARVLDRPTGQVLSIAASAMEFSSAYAIAPSGTSLTKTAYYSWARFYRADGSVLEGAGSTRGRSVIARTLLTERVYARLDRATPDVQRAMRKGQPNFFLVFDRLGIDPFTDMFEITLLAEGTVRGTGGIRITGNDCSTSVPGLYAAGDTATRELICGGFTGGGSHNAAWAASSGSWAGHAAAVFASRRGRHLDQPRPVGSAGLRPAGAPMLAYQEVVAEVQRAVLPYDHNYARHANKLAPALDILHQTWSAVRDGLTGAGEDLFRAREAAAMTAHGRWMFHAALQRTETRGMHKRLDYPQQDPAQQFRLLTGGLEDIWTRPETGSRAFVATGGLAA